MFVSDEHLFDKVVRYLRILLPLLVVGIIYHNISPNRRVVAYTNDLNHRLLMLKQCLVAVAFLLVISTWISVVRFDGHQQQVSPTTCAALDRVFVQLCGFIIILTGYIAVRVSTKMKAVTAHDDASHRHRRYFNGLYTYVGSHFLLAGIALAIAGKMGVAWVDTASLLMCASSLLVFSWCCLILQARPSRKPQGSAAAAAAAAAVEESQKEDLTCAICLMLAVGATQTPCCGAVWCRACIEHVRNMKCPNCCADFQLHQLTPDHRSERRSAAMSRPCSFESDGCTFSGNRSKVAHHEQHGCQHGQRGRRLHYLERIMAYTGVIIGYMTSAEDN